MDLLLHSYSAPRLLTGMKTHRVGIVEGSRRRSNGPPKTDDIHIEVPVTISEAVLGTNIEVPTIDGKARLKIPPSTSSGKVFRLREKGVLNRRTNRRGDQFARVKIVVPEIPDEGSKDLLRDFANLNPEDPRGRLWQ